MGRLIVGGRCVGELNGTTLVKRGKQVIKMNVFDGFGIPQHLVHDSRIENIELHYTDDKIYRAAIGKFIERGIPYHRPPYEAQYILPVEYFSVHDPRQVEVL